jgi:transglutaminase/protease-like cytokinesis protein 3
MLDEKYRPASENTDPGETVAVTGVSVTPSTSEISSLGSTKQLNAVVSPSNASNSNVVWSSSNDDVATVCQTGLVTAKSEGTATNTATTDDGDFTANSSITVSIGTGGCATFSKIEGEDYDDMFGITVGSSRDTDGTDCVKDPQAGDWVIYSDIDLTCAKSVSARVSSYRIGGNFEVRIDAVDGELIGTIEQGTTGAWTTWVTASINITSVTGVHNVYLVFTDGSNTTLYLNWFEFSTEDTTLSTVEFDTDLIKIFPNPATN